jgi:excisionase family DNA binding protein
MTTEDFIQTLRQDIKQNLREELLQEIMPIVEQRLYSNVFDLQEAGRYLKRSASTLRRMVDENEIPFFRQRGQIFFRQTDLDAWISNLVKTNTSQKARKNA